MREEGTQSCRRGHIAPMFALLIRFPGPFCVLHVRRQIFGTGSHPEGYLAELSVEQWRQVLDPAVFPVGALP